MPRMLDLSDDVRAEIGDHEADRLLTGHETPGGYDCTSCRTPGDSELERTSTVLFVGEETEVLAFAHAGCLPSQVVRVSEEELQGAVRSLTESQPAVTADAPPPAVLGVTSGLVLLAEELHPALVIEPTGPVARPGSTAGVDEFGGLLLEHGFRRIPQLIGVPPVLPGWSVLMASGRLHSVLQPGPTGGPAMAWWQAHQPLIVTESWRQAASRHQQVLVFAAPAGSIGRQPREDLMREALDRAAPQGLLAGAAMPLAGA